MIKHQQFYRQMICRILSNAKRILLIILIISMLTSWLLYSWLYFIPITTEKLSNNNSHYYYYHYYSTTSYNTILQNDNQIKNSINKIQNYDNDDNIAIENWINKCQPNIARYFDVCQKYEQSNGHDDNDDDHGKNELQTHVRLPSYSDNNVSLNGIYDRIYLYEAYERFEQTKNNNIYSSSYSINIISIVNRIEYCQNEQNNQLLYCYMKKNDNNKIIITKAKLQCLPEHHDYLYTAAIITCLPPPPPSSSSSLFESNFDSVIITDNNLNKQTKWLPINKQKTNSTTIQSVVCVRPLFDSINLFNLFEFIEYYYNQDFDRIILYYYENDNFNEKAKNLLSYMNETMSNMVKLKSILLPEFIWKQIHSGGQLLTINDCLYQYPNSIQLHVDIDEFVSFANDNNDEKMKNNITIMKMIKKYWFKSQTSYIALYIDNLLHCHEFNLAYSNYYEFEAARLKYSIESIKTNHNNNDFCHPNQSNQTVTMNIKILAQLLNNNNNHFEKNLTINEMKKLLLVPNSIYSQATPWPNQLRSKVIILRPSLIDMLGIHQVWKFRQYNTNSNNDNNIVINSFIDHLYYLIWSKWTLTSDKQILFTYKNINNKQLILRHYRWCCHLKQPYLFQLLQFNSLSDKIIHWQSNHQIDWLKISLQIFKHYNQLVHHQ
ncbi:uncharacterized protein LOC142644963 [Dermatophagoides pteronyssinus]|uniref:uncharacterized protein LOC142644963 n=1 Tax=Dermatophagoides pteronyssinus TaxID=6956 RepID=UPI003F67A441